MSTLKQKPKLATREVTITIPIPEDVDTASLGYCPSHVPGTLLRGEDSRRAFKALVRGLADSGATVGGKPVRSPDRAVQWLFAQVAEQIEFSRYS